ncbi:MAG TPA: O-antigen ligase family protein [Thermoanaerobacter sp.]|nr:O-antigen ligase family protein [Thermoanaerobacter sp.]
MINSSKYSYKRIFLINYKLFLFILSITPLYFFKNKYIKLFGSISVIIIFLLCIFDTAHRIEKIKVDKVWFWFLAFSSYNLILLFRTPTAKGLYSFLLQTLLLLFISLFSSMSLNSKVIDAIFKWGRALYFVILVLSTIVLLESRRTVSGIFGNYFSTVVVFKIMLPCTFFFMPNSKFKFGKIIFFSFIFFMIEERTSLLTLLIIYLSYLVFKKIGSNKILYNVLFVLTFILMLSITNFYIQLQHTELGYFLNDIFRKYTGENFFSGRQIIWEVAHNYIKNKPIWGYGLDNELMHISGIDLSTHNTYIYILLQGGSIGLLTFFMFVHAIYERYFNNLNDDTIAFAAAYLIGMMVFINFEVTLIGNTVVLGIFLWFILGIGLVQCNNKRLLPIHNSNNEITFHK